jgi:hypothetical protein
MMAKALILLLLFWVACEQRNSPVEVSPATHEPVPVMMVYDASGNPIWPDRWGDGSVMTWTIVPVMPAEDSTTGICAIGKAADGSASFIAGMDSLGVARIGFWLYSNLWTDNDRPITSYSVRVDRRAPNGEVYSCLGPVEMRIDDTGDLVASGFAALNAPVEPPLKQSLSPGDPGYDERWSVSLGDRRLGRDRRKLMWEFRDVWRCQGGGPNPLELTLTLSDDRENRAIIKIAVGFWRGR